MDIILRELKVKYEQRNVLDDISLSFTDSLNFLIGPNGSGKTSLFRSILQEVPYSGRVLFGKHDISTLKATERARHLAIVYQRLHVPDHLKVSEFVLMGRFPYLSWLGGYSVKDHQIVARSLDRLEISSLAERTVKSLSGGEQQRVFIARALSQDTPWLLLDEPAQTLDPAAKRFLYHLLKDLSEEGKKILCVSHDIGEISMLGGRTIGLKEGKVVYDRAGEEDPAEIHSIVFGIE